ncbi:protein arginine N-methyltransferase 7 isoform X2 [Oryza sativa Japonica Group]|uniref:protein arginine N-methyltransferase 7 isoform X2 n=1 Tax=Oryza sativa subsp. japonica TaxID=39947 RepID=UPI0007754050|nr:protein arginine N-methyltransferase 7 isoform X3 [Oryza sativa Japonica Group]
MPSCCCLLGLGFPSPPSALRILRRRMASRAFQLRLNPLTGDSEWLVVEEEEEEDHHPTPPPKQLLATTSYLDMLNDSARNRAYRRAIEAAVTDPSSRVLDIGAGTGLLSMMAARALAAVGGETRGGSVSACESYLPMGKLMRRVLRANGMENRVKVFHKRSDELKVRDDLDSPADILVSEILDSELLGEGLIPTLQQAYDMLLAKNPKIVPYRATTYGQLVESTFLWKLHDLHNNEANAADGVWLTPGEMERIVSVKPQQHAMQCDALEDEIRLLSEPFKVFEFDFWKRPDSHREANIKIRTTRDGYVHAIISWWVLQLDSAGSIFYSTAPRWARQSNMKDWCDHWKQCVWFMQGKGIPATEDQVLSLRARHNQTSISYQLNINDEACDRSSKGDHLTLLPERIALYGDKDWRSALINTIKNALTVKSSPTCVVADDSMFLALLISSMSPTSKVIAMYPGLRDKGAAYLRSVADANNFSIDQIQVIGKRASSITADDLKHKKVNLLVGEPFYLGSEGMLPWQNLRFWSVRTLLDSMLSEDAFIMPCKGILKLCAMSLPDLWRSRSSLKDVEGFDHSVVNETLGACGCLPGDQQGPCLPYYVWQCGYTKKLSKVYSLMDFNFSEPIHSCFGKTKIEFSHDGTCHGFAVWIDWVLDERKSVVLTTGPDNRYWKQGVQLFSKPVEVNPGKSVMHVEASFDPSTGEITFSSSSTTCS